jgi:hypothetical protein
MACRGTALLYFFYIDTCVKGTVSFVAGFRLKVCIFHPCYTYYTPHSLWKVYIMKLLTIKAKIGFTISYYCIQIWRLHLRTESPCTAARRLTVVSTVESTVQSHVSLCGIWRELLTPNFTFILPIVIPRMSQIHFYRTWSERRGGMSQSVYPNGSGEALGSHSGEYEDELSSEMLLSVAYRNWPMFQRRLLPPSSGPWVKVGQFLPETPQDSYVEGWNSKHWSIQIKNSFSQSNLS